MQKTPILVNVEGDQKDYLLKVAGRGGQSEYIRKLIEADKAKAETGDVLTAGVALAELNAEVAAQTEEEAMRAKAAPLFKLSRADLLLVFWEFRPTASKLQGAARSLLLYENAVTFGYITPEGEKGPNWAMLVSKHIPPEK